MHQACCFRGQYSIDSAQRQARTESVHRVPRRDGTVDEMWVGVFCAALAAPPSPRVVGFRRGLFRRGRGSSAGVPCLRPLPGTLWSWSPPLSPRTGPLFFSGCSFPSPPSHFSALSWRRLRAVGTRLAWGSQVLAVSITQWIRVHSGDPYAVLGGCCFYSGMGQLPSRPASCGASVRREGLALGHRWYPCRLFFLQLAASFPRPRGRVPGTLVHSRAASFAVPRCGRLL